MNNDKINANNSNQPLSNEQLLAQLNSGLFNASQTEISKEVEDDAFFADALEGLSNIKDKQAIDNQIEGLNAQLNTLIKDRNKKKLKRKLPTNRWTIIAIALTLGLATMGYLIIYLINKY